MKRIGFAIALIFWSSMALAAPSDIYTQDVALFYKVYDAAGGHPTAEQLQHDYIDKGSVGLRRLAAIRKVTGARIAQEIERHPELYVDARRCLTVLPRVKLRLARAFGKLEALDPEMRFAPVTIAIGRGKPVGVTDETGVMIGLEALCATKYLNPDVEDRFVYVIAHEYAHVQQAAQSPVLFNKDKPTVLEASLIEGAAEFTSELIAGKVAYGVFATSTRGREEAIETDFVRDEDKTDLSDWFYNGTPEKPGDLGYWVGYRIVKSYYLHAPDKRAALGEIFRMSDAKAFLAKSGWHPGISLP